MGQGQQGLQHTVDQLVIRAPFILQVTPAILDDRAGNGAAIGVQDE